MSQADDIRRFIKRHYIKPSRDQGLSQIKINAGDVDRKMQLGRVPNVNNVLKGKKLQKECKIELIRMEGNNQSTTASYTFKLLPSLERTPKISSRKKIKCLSCGYTNKSDNKFCEQCGVKLNVCLNCGKAINPTSKYCGKCGTKL